jgi:hypothetical protein
VKEVALGGLLAALSAFLFGLVAYMDFAGLFVYLSSTPLAAGAVLFGVPFALEVAGASTLLVSLWLSPFPGGVHHLITQLPLGVCLGYCFAKNLPHRRTLLAAVVTLALSQGVVFLIDLYFLGINPENFLSFAAPLFRVSEDLLLEWSLLLYPAFIFLYSLCFAVYIWFFNVVILRRFRLITQEVHPFAEIPALMDVSPGVLYLAPPALVLTGLAEMIPSRGLLYLGVNILAVLALFCYIKGFFLLNRSMRLVAKAPKPLRLIALLLSFLFSITAGIPILSAVGLVALPREAMVLRASGKYTKLHKYCP